MNKDARTAFAAGVLCGVIGVGGIIVVTLSWFFPASRSEADLYNYREVSGYYQEYPELRSMIDKVYEDDTLTQREFAQVLDARMKAAAKRIIAERKNPEFESGVSRYGE